jgi:hypothetical protein
VLVLVVHAGQSVSFPLRHNSASGTANCATSQAKQTTNSETTQTGGPSFAIPEKRMGISPVSLSRLSDPHDVQVMGLPYLAGDAMVEDDDGCVQYS